jgi:hypothetical protein
LPLQPPTGKDRLERIDDLAKQSVLNRYKQFYDSDKPMSASDEKAVLLGLAEGKSIGEIANILTHPIKRRADGKSAARDATPDELAQTWLPDGSFGKPGAAAAPAAGSAPAVAGTAAAPAVPQVRGLMRMGDQSVELLGAGKGPTTINSKYEPMYGRNPETGMITRGLPPANPAFRPLSEQRGAVSQVDRETQIAQAMAKFPGRSRAEIVAALTRKGLL